MTTEPHYKPRDWASHPPYRYADYKSTALRGPTKPLVPLKHTLSELTGPVYGHESVGPLDNDLTKNGVKDGEPLGERIVVTGRVLDENGRPVPDALIEIWQANAAGRYIHKVDQHDGADRSEFLRRWALRDRRRRAATASIRCVPAPIPGAITTTPGGRTIFTCRSSVPPCRHVW